MHSTYSHTGFPFRSVRLLTFVSLIFGCGAGRIWAQNQSQTITFAPLPDQTYGVAPFSLHATASSGLQVSFASKTPTICKVSGGSVSLLASGTCSINATQTGDSSYAAAQPVLRSFSVHHATQTITFASIPATSLAKGSVSLHATASSGLPIAFASTTPSVCTASGKTATLLALGACTITATQAGNAQYYGPTSWTRNFSVTLATQTIAFMTLPPVTYGTAPFSISARASSGLQVSFASTTPSICRVSGSTVTLLASGSSCAIQATQAGNNLYAPASGVLQSFSVLYETDAMLAASQLAAGNQARLQRLIEKGRNGAPVTMVTIGGSITAGGGASDGAHYYGRLLQDWWNEIFPSSTSTLVNAGVGGTRSDYGSLRARRDVLAYNPDLVVVEFAVNDFGAGQDGDTYEGLVRQLLDAPSQPAVILLFMMTYKPGYLESQTTQQGWQSAVGANYNVPMVSYFDAIAPELLNGNITDAQITPDQVHPSDLGHAYAAQFLERNLQIAIVNFPAGTPLEPVPVTHAPFYSSDFEFTSLVQGNGTLGPPLNPTSNQDWVSVSASPGARPDYPDAGLQSSSPGSTLDFTVKGKEILVGYWGIDGPMGQVSVSVDGAAATTLDGFNPTLGGDLQLSQVASGLTDGPHQVYIELLSTQNSGGNTFDVLCVGAGGVF